MLRLFALAFAPILMEPALDAGAPVVFALHKAKVMA